MKGFILNLEEATAKNQNFRRVLYTAKNCQLVLMSLKPGEDIGEETHHLDQFIRFESGKGKVILNQKEHAVFDGFAVVIPAGVRHNVINTSGSSPLKLYSVYTPPEHQDGVVQKNKSTETTHAEFDGKTTES